MPSIVVDSNVPFIATGQIGEAWAVVILEEISKGRADACTTTFYQEEILDAYTHLQTVFEGRKIFRSFRRIVPHALDVSVEDFDRSRELFDAHPEKSPRDLINVAAMERHRLKEIFSLDGPDFDNLQQIQVIRLPDFLSRLGIDGDYVYERFKNKNG